MAAGLVPLAHASDGGGSIRVPASVCGLFGFKPSRGRTVAAALASSDFGDLVSDHCVTRSVRDSALFLSITEDRAGTLPPVGHVQGPSARRLRVGAWTQTLMGEAPDVAVVRAHDEALALLEQLEQELIARTARAVGYTPIHNVAGCPAMSVPLAWSDEGLPLGAHFAAAPGADAALLALAYELEVARPWSERWAPYSYPVLFGDLGCEQREAAMEASCPRS